jgi:transcriptional regulator with XRE-family HTH domain
MNNAITYSNSTGWASTTSTGTSLGFVLGAISVVSLAVIGTGAPLVSDKTPKPILANQHVKYALDTSYRAPSEDLQVVKEYFSPSVSDLSSALGVSRQTVYNWLKGATVADDNAMKIKELADAASILSSAGVKMTVSLLKRKFSDGKTLFQIVQAGGSGQDAARQLVTAFKREQAQREKLNALRMKKVVTSTSADFDLPTSDASNMGG